MHVLVLNPGSATLKFRLVLLDPSGTRTLADGLVETGPASGERLPHAAAEVIGKCQPLGIDAVGCRVVHGGERFSEPTRVTPEVLATIRDLGRLAPLHNPVAAAVLDAVAGLLPGVPIVAVFDTSFHRSMPEVAALYALPLELAREKGWRRYGFHGTSHEFVTGRLLERLGKAAAGTRLITCHLGNGASVCAVRDGRSIDTSMGLTPLEGLVMGTRSGDVDPGLVLHLLREEGMSVEEVDRLLNQQSGLLGLGGHSDVRDLEAAARGGDERAELALAAFAYRVRKYVGGYAAALGGVDAIAFTGGIGEHSGGMRRRICEPLAWLGVKLDEGANEGKGSERRISEGGGGVEVWVIGTDEEGAIARATMRLSLAR